MRVIGSRRIATLSKPPADTIVPLAKPPKSTACVPPLETTVASAVPPDWTSRTLPLVTVTPELTTLAGTNWMVIEDALVLAFSCRPACAARRLRPKILLFATANRRPVGCRDAEH